jgi:pyruvate,orthophosphate dikinase
MAGLPVTVRLLDPPLHEFLPDRVDLALQLDRLPRGGERDRVKRIADRVQALSEQNPMLGTRGSRLGILHPDIYRMQVRAIVRGALDAARSGPLCEIEIMLPLITWPGELTRLRALVEDTVAAELEAAGRTLEVMVGTMIELPRACLCAGQLAEEAEFFSFGTNDLTQTVCGLSRDDAESRFLAAYVQQGLVERNPFETIDEAAVGELVRLGCERGRAVRADLRLGICGEHGADPESVRFFHRTGLEYVSCSPYRVPVARLAAAQAALEEPRQSIVS